MDKIKFIVIEHPLLVFGFLAFVFITALLYLFQRNSKTGFLLISIFFVAVIFTYFTEKAFFPKLKRAFFNQQKEIHYYYDTDPKNDKFIKGDLSKNKLKKFDKILMAEKENSGLRFSTAKVNQLTGNDNDLIDAYDRWRKCKEMRRSYHRTIYPDERDKR